MAFSLSSCSKEEVEPEKEEDEVTIIGTWRHYTNEATGDYYQITLEEDGTLIADNVLYRGMVRSDEYVVHKHRSMINNLRAFLKEIEAAEYLDTKVYEIGDGIAVIKKK